MLIGDADSPASHLTLLCFWRGLVRAVRLAGLNGTMKQRLVRSEQGDPSSSEDPIATIENVCSMFNLSSLSFYTLLPSASRCTLTVDFGSGTISDMPA